MATARARAKSILAKLRGALAPHRALIDELAEILTQCPDDSFATPGGNRAQDIYTKFLGNVRALNIGRTVVHIVRPELSANTAAVYSRARRKANMGKQLNSAERQRLDVARDRRVARTEAGERRTMHEKTMQEVDTPFFKRTRWGWRIVIPGRFPGGPWSARDEVEVVTRTGRAQWVTLIEMVHTSKNDADRFTWWKFCEGRQSKVTLHVDSTKPAPIVEAEDKSEPSFVDVDDDQPVTGVGAALLNARRKRDALRKEG